MSSSQRVVKVVNLGRMAYRKALEVQVQYARRHLDELAGKAEAIGQDTLLLVEHNPVYTIGVRTSQYTLDDRQKLVELGAEFHPVARGGLITYHGPGQLVAYPILNLTHFRKSIRWYVGALEDTLVRTCKGFGLKAGTTMETGVWIDNRKIAAVGVNARRWVTHHGIALNCNTDLSWFMHIVPCGIEGKEVTSLSRELDRDVPVDEAKEFFLKSFSEVFDCELTKGGRKTRERDTTTGVERQQHMS